MATDVCGEEGNIEGGSISGSTILDSDVVDSRINSSSFEKGAITNLVDIDDSSVKVIVDAIASLSQDQLATLARVIFTAYTGTPIAAPAATETSSMPTKVTGGRDNLLGTPTAWMPVGGYALPLYTKGA